MSDDEDIGFQKKRPDQPAEGPRPADSRLPGQPPLDINTSNVNNNNPQPAQQLPPSHRTDTRNNEQEKQDLDDNDEEGQTEVRASDAGRQQQAHLHEAGIHHHL